MKIVVTGSAGHLGEALCRVLSNHGHEVAGVDILASPFTTHQGSITDVGFLSTALAGAEIIFHPATLHKPHVATHSYQDFIDVNIVGTLNLLQAARDLGARRFIFTSTTSVFGEALTPPLGQPAAWITEEVFPVPKNIYGVTKIAAEGLCQLFHRNTGLRCAILRTSRFFPEIDDNQEMRANYSDENGKVNEFLFRRVELEDAVSAHLAAAERLDDIGFGKYIISATHPFSREDLPGLRENAPAVVQRLFPDFDIEYARRDWKMFPQIDRVYVNEKARIDLGWQPRFDYRYILDRLKQGLEWRSPLALLVRSKGYHQQTFAEGPYPV